ncbi:MAG TPA: YihY/virulence factor BrkB family protein [Terriglobales bacterium]|nr:YihY/virulence factor BrkB family protein [Terriglobales bacterium]
MRWARLLRSTLLAAGADDLLDWSAALSFYFLFALFPTVLIVASLLGTLHLEGLVQHLVVALTRHLPLESAALVSRELHELLLNNVPGLASLGVILLLYSASQGFSGLMAALNAAYEVPETRSFWRRIAVAYGLTFSAGIFIALALTMLLLGQRMLTVLAGPVHLGVVLTYVWPAIRWAVTIGFMMLAVRLLYRYAPNVRRETHGINAAVACAMVIWLAGSAILAYYINHFSQYSAIYGSLSAVIALMLWFYIFSLSILLGAELHNEWLKARGIRLATPVRPKPASTAPPGKAA